jgi:hypothetical protein
MIGDPQALMADSIVNQSRPEKMQGVARYLQLPIDDNVWIRKIHSEEGIVVRHVGSQEQRPLSANRQEGPRHEASPIVKEAIGSLAKGPDVPMPIENRKTLAPFENASAIIAELGSRLDGV